MPVRNTDAISTTRGPFLRRCRRLNSEPSQAETTVDGCGNQGLQMGLRRSCAVELERFDSAPIRHTFDSTLRFRAIGWPSPAQTSSRRLVWKDAQEQPAHRPLSPPSASRWPEGPPQEKGQIPIRGHERGSLHHYTQYLALSRVF